MANKVQTRSGKWLSIYGKVLFEHTVAASEAYNTALELRLAEALGVEFVERPAGARDMRPVREIAGVPALLCERWPQRRKAITTRQRELAREFTQAHGRPPTPVEAVALAQQANLETRDAKHEPRAETEQRAGWRAEAVEVLGSQVAVRAMVAAVVRRSRSAAPPVSSAWVETAAEQVVAEVGSRRATWQVWHLRAEAQRQVRGVAVPADRVGEVVEWIVDDAITRLSVNLTPDVDPVSEPVGLRRSDGTSVYRHTGRDHYSSQRVLEAEQRIVALAGHHDALAWSPDDVTLAVLAAGVNDIHLNQGQEALAQAMATSGARVQLALAPAGSGKTTAMRVLAEVWREGGCSTLGLAPSAAAATALAEATGMPCETLAKLTRDLTHNPTSSLASSIGPGTLVVVDEAGMADTLTLAAVLEHAMARGASVRLVGDDRQLAAIGAGGVLRDIASTHGACKLDDLVRFADPSEGEASLALRDGDRSALGFYLYHDRVHVGDVASCLDDVYAAWSAERATGRDCLMLAPARDLVRELNLRAQASRALSGASIGLADGCQAHCGDVVISRRNVRRLGVSGTDWVKNGNRWIVTCVRADGGLDVQHATSRLHATLPAEYISAHVDLGYSATVHTAQGITADVVHGLVTGTEDRQMLYTMLTRGRIENHAHLMLDVGETHAVPSSVADRMLTATEVLEGVLARDGAAASATSVQARAASSAALLHDAAARYADAVALATTQVRAEPVEDGPLPWLAGIPDEVAEHPSWGPYLGARARRVVAFAADVASALTLPEWMARYDADVLTPDLRRELAIWRAAVGVSEDERTTAGPLPYDDREASYHHRLTRRIADRYGAAVQAWADRVVEYVGTRDDQTLELAKHLDQLARRGVDAERILGRAAARKPLPIDHATAALASRVRSLSAARQRVAPPTDFSSRPYERQSGPRWGL